QLVHVVGGLRRRRFVVDLEVLDLAATELAAVLLDVEAEAVLDGFAELGVGAGVRQHQAGAQLVLGLGQPGQQGDGGDADGEAEGMSDHAGLLVAMVVVILPELGAPGGGPAVVQRASRSRSRSRSRKRWILPVAVLGSSAMNSTCRGYLCGASRCLTKDCSSEASASSPARPALRTTNALVRVRPFSSSTPITAASSTASCWTSVASTSKGETYWPLTLSMSSLRPA